MRDNGWYWVMCEGEDEWNPAEFEDGYWYLQNDRLMVNDQFFKRIHEVKLKPPVSIMKDDVGYEKNREDEYKGE